MKREVLPILFADDDVVVIDKPSGMLSLPDRFDTTLPNIRRILEDMYGEIYIVHRLDKETSGVMIAARNAQAHKNLSEQFEHHTIRKIYHAIVSGVVEQDEFPINIPLMADPKRKGLMRPSARGKDAHTIVKVLERFRIASLIECTLVTGRMHQIRVHCSAIGHPLLVDPDYGTTKEFLLSSIKRRYNLKKDTTERPVIDRLTLHAKSIAFLHPSTSQSVEFTSEYPRDVAAAINVLRKYSAPYSSTLRWE